MPPESRPPHPVDTGRRKDFRLAATEASPLVAECLTKSGVFREQVRDVSAQGAFLVTTRPLEVGQEIAVTIPLAGSKATIRATGEVVRAEPSGYGIEFRVIFRY